MRISMSVSIKIFFRSIIYLAICAVLFLLSNFFLMRFFNASNYLAEFHVASLKLGIVGYIVFSFLSYEYTNLPRTSALQEALEIIPSSRSKLLCSQSLVLISLLLIWSINIFGWILGKYVQLQIHYPAFFLNSIPSIFIDFFLPGVIAILVGALLSQKTVREVAYCIIIVSALVCSPVPSGIFASESILGYPVLTFFDWFSILAPNTSWVADDIYGASIEAYRWVLAAFWILLLTAAIVFATAKRNRKTYMMASVLIVLSFLCGVRFVCRSNDSIIRKDYRPYGTLQHEFTYRQKYPEQQELPADFHVSKYCIELTVRNNTKATVRIELKENDRNEYRFTLYHGYVINSIKDRNGDKLNFDQNGDYVTVYAPMGTKELNFSYSGSAGKYFSNYQGIALPGYLPYYPVPGFVKFYEAGQIVVNTDLEPTDYEVYVDSNMAVASNLPKTDDNTFSGNADAVSLYGGMIVSEEKEGIVCWYSPIGVRSIKISGYQEAWKRLADQVGETAAFDLMGKTIFMQPVTIMAANSGQEGYVEFSDHIITADWSVTADSLCKQHLLATMPKEKSTMLLYNVFSDYLIFGGSREAAEIPWSSIEILTRYDSANEIEDLEEWSEYIEASNLFSELFSYKANLLGEDFVLKTVYQYLKKSAPECNQIEFLYRLGE